MRWYVIPDCMYSCHKQTQKVINFIIDYSTKVFSHLTFSLSYLPSTVHDKQFHNTKGSLQLAASMVHTRLAGCVSVTRLATVTVGCIWCQQLDYRLMTFNNVWCYLEMYYPSMLYLLMFYAKNTYSVCMTT